VLNAKRATVGGGGGGGGRTHPAALHSKNNGCAEASRAPIRDPVFTGWGRSPPTRMAKRRQAVGVLLVKDW